MAWDLGAGLGRHTFALAAVSKCGAVFTHGAPAAQCESVADLEAADLSGAGLSSPLDVLDTPIVGKILWARSATEAEAPPTDGEATTDEAEGASDEVEATSEPTTPTEPDAPGESEPPAEPGSSADPEVPPKPPEP